MVDWDFDLEGFVFWIPCKMLCQFWISIKSAKGLFLGVHSLPAHELHDTTHLFCVHKQKQVTHNHFLIFIHSFSLQQIFMNIGSWTGCFFLWIVLIPFHGPPFYFNAWFWSPIQWISCSLLPSMVSILKECQHKPELFCINRLPSMFVTCHAMPINWWFLLWNYNFGIIYICKNFPSFFTITINSVIVKTWILDGCRPCVWILTSKE